MHPWAPHCCGSGPDGQMPALPLTLQQASWSAHTQERGLPGRTSASLTETAVSPESRGLREGGTHSRASELLLVPVRGPCCQRGEEQK